MPGTYEKALRLQGFRAGEAERLEIARKDEVQVFFGKSMIYEIYRKIMKFHEIY